QRLFDAFTSMLPMDWGLDESSADVRLLSRPLPMVMNRRPQAVPGLLLVHEALIKDRPGLAMMYPAALRQRYGRYFSIGRGFARGIGRPAIMNATTRFLLPRPRVMGFAMRVLANLSDGPDGDLQDRLFFLLQRLGRTT